MDLIKIGKQLASLRKEQGLTGEKLAEILNVSPQAVSKWENGKCLPETALLPSLAKALDCTIDTLLMPNDKSCEDNDKVEAFYAIMNENDRLISQTKEFTRSKHIISRYLFNKKMEIADIGGGTGAYSFWLAEKGHDVHLFDLTPKHIEIAEQKAKIGGVALCSYTCGDARDLPYNDESMDLVLIMGPLYHFQSQESRLKCLTEAYRILKHGGHVICTVIGRYTALVTTLKHNLFHVFSTDTLEKLIKTGMSDAFNIVQAYAHTPSEIMAELSSTGFENTHVVAVEGILNAFGDYSLPTDEKEAASLLKCIELTETIPELMGVSRNLMAVGSK